MSDTSSEDERPSFIGAGLGANRRKFTSGPGNDREGSPVKKMRFTKQSKGGRANDVPAYSKAGSFAARMMAQMGYKEGEGLGKEGKGRLAPIETQLRPQGAGLGAVKEKTKQAKQEEKREAAFRGETVEDSSEEERERRKQQKQRRPGVAPTTSYQKPKVKYRTAREIELESKGLEVPNVLKTLIDVSGNRTELLLHDAPSITDSEEVKIARRARRDLEAYSEDWKALQERKRYYEEEFQRHTHEMNRIHDRASNLEKLLTEMDGLASLNAQEAGIDIVSEMLQLLEIRLHISSESTLKETLKTASLNVQEVAVAVVTPPFARIMKDWDPLATDNPHSVVDSLTMLKESLGLQDSLAIAESDGIPAPRRRQAGSYYATMINTYWLPVVRDAIINRWQVEDSEPITKIVELWTNLLPPFVSSTLINQLVIPRLAEAIKKWRPGSRLDGERHFVRVNPDTFLFPWLPWLPSQHLDPKASSGLLSDVRRKFAQELGKYDVSWGPPQWAAPWKQVKSFKATLSTLYTNYLVPRLAQHIDKMNYKPTQERRMESNTKADWPLRYLSEWHEVLGEKTILYLLTAHFFPRLMKITLDWLQTKPSVNQIGNFMQSWNNSMTEYVQDLPEIQAAWSKIVVMIERALYLGDYHAEEFAGIEETSYNPAAQQDETLSDVNEADEPTAADLLDEPDFKSLVEWWCENHDLMLIPSHTMHAQNGLLLYRVTANASGKGGVQVYLDDYIVWTQPPKAKGTFVPMMLHTELAEWASGRPGRN